MTDAERLYVGKLKTALQDCVRALSIHCHEMSSCNRVTHNQRTIDVDPAGNTYEITPQEWWVRAQTLAKAEEEA